MKGIEKICIPEAERRIDYILINNKEQNVCVEVEIMENGKRQEGLV